MAKIRVGIHQQADLVGANVCVNMCVLACLSAGLDKRTDPSGFPLPEGL